MTILLSAWHLVLPNAGYLLGAPAYWIWRATPWSKRLMRRAAARSAERRLRRPGKPDENGWRVKINYKRKDLS